MVIHPIQSHFGKIQNKSGKTSQEQASCRFDPGALAEKCRAVSPVAGERVAGVIAEDEPLDQLLSHTAKVEGDLLENDFFF